MSAEQNFAERYKAMSETELMGLAREYDNLTDAAQSALRAEFARRGLEPPLIEEEEEPIVGDEPDLVTVGHYNDVAETLLARAVLEEAGIKCFVRDENTARILSDSIGGMRLQVAARDEAAANEVLLQLGPEHFEDDSDEEFVQPVCPKCGATDVIANDPDREAVAVSVRTKLTLSHWRPHEVEWRCMSCGCVWADEEEPAEQGGHAAID